MDVSIYWKHAYTFGDDNMEVKERSPKTEKGPQKIQQQQPYKIDVAPKTSLSPKSVDIAAKPPLPKIPIYQPPQKLSQEGASQKPSQEPPHESPPSSLSNESDNSRLQSKSEESSSVESVIVIGSPELEKKSGASTAQVSSGKTRLIPIPPTESTETPPRPKPRNKAVDPVELERRLSQEVKQEEYDPDLEDAPLSIVPPPIFEGSKEIAIETPSPASYISSAESDTTYTQEHPTDEFRTSQILEITDDMLVDSEEEESRKQPQPARRSLLGQLPPLNKEQIPEHARQGIGASRVVEFSEPLHSSIPRLLKG